MDTQQSLVDMGFSAPKIERAIEACGQNVEQAMEWLLAHADDDQAMNTETPHLVLNSPKGGSTKNETEENTEKEGNNSVKENEANPSKEEEEEMGEKEVKSIKCDECDKLFKSSEEVEFHAVKSGHNSFSESTQEKKTLSEEEKREKLKELEEKMRQRRKEKEEDERKEAVVREKKRIQMSRDIAETKKRIADQEIRRIAEERRKEKLEDKLARERVKEQIARDREARKQMFQNNVTVTPPPVSNQQASGSTNVQPQVQKKDYISTRLQIRLPSGPPLIQEFKAKESLSAVRLWVKLNRTDRESEDNFLLSTTFPRKIFSEEDMDKPLSILGLVPSAVLVITDK